VFQMAYHSRRAQRALSLAVLVVLAGCKVITCTITSDPPGGDIYGGPNPDSMTFTGFQTPHTFELKVPVDQYWLPWYFRVERDGCEPRTQFRPFVQQDHLELHFKLQQNPSVRYGAAGS